MKSTPLLPQEDARDTALFFVVCALCFLAALAALSARAAYSAAEAWTSDVTGQITIRIEGEQTERVLGPERLDDVLHRQLHKRKPLT